jgi:hypothetical protein
LNSLKCRRSPFDSMFTLNPILPISNDYKTFSSEGNGTKLDS